MFFCKGKVCEPKTLERNLLENTWKPLKTDRCVQIFQGTPEQFSRAKMCTLKVLPLILLVLNYLQFSSAAISSQVTEFGPKYHYADTARTFDGKLVITPHRHFIVTFKPNINEGKVGY